MPIYIYRGGSNPGPQNPFLRLLVSIAVLAAMVGIGVLLLPVIGVVALIILGLVVVTIIGGLIYRAMYGDPLARMREMNEDMRINPQSANPFGSRTHQEDEEQAPKRFRSQVQDVEDAVVVEEKQRPSDH